MARVMAAALREAAAALPTAPFREAAEAPRRPATHARFTSPVNLAGLPALALLVPTGSGGPRSLQRSRTGH